VKAPKLEVRDDADVLAQDVATALTGEIHRAISEHGRAHIVLTGGGIGTAVLGALVPMDIDWRHVDLWWGDERFLAEDSPDRNATQARHALLDHIAIPAANVHAMPSNTGQSAEQAAMTYADELARSSADGTVPRFDVLLLGVGPEGHIASTFPDSPAASAAGTVCAVHQCPKPPPTRVSLTFPAIRSAAQVWLIASGAAKAEAIARAAAPGTNPVDVPAAGAVGHVDTVFWLDRDAAADLP